VASGDVSRDERTEQPSAKRREDARRKGQVVKSPDLTGAAALLGALGAFSMMGPGLVAAAVEALRRGIDASAHAELTPATALAMFASTSVAIAHLAWPFVVIPALVAVAVQLLQTRFAASWEALGPDWKRIDPMKGLGRLLSLSNAVDGLKTVLKLALLGVVAYLTLEGAWPVLLGLGHGEAAIADVGQVVRDLWLRIGLAYLAVSALDYAHKWWVHERDLRMTRQEVKDETREQEGNPLLKSRLRALHRQRATRRMMAEVEHADVVVRNPVHYAVALKYEGGRMRAPRVVAKGARLMARRIVDLAFRHGVPVVENPPLARSLYKMVAVGQDIPKELYRMVAEVLAHVYALRDRRR
jgi:flagellar biosynthetic protein FlhB